ncbi:MAG: flagellar filament capping protein FliD [Sedimentisphaerales bacterium]|nr:flagellar filament capping protein FliD [Sedimentisphaerales bacterium]
MGELRLPGLATGIDTAKLISQLMAIERRTLNKYMARQDTWNERKNALSSLKTKLETLKSTAAALSDARQLRAYATTSSDTDILTAESSNNAFEGNHTVVIDQLANADRWVHTVGAKYAEDYVGEGTFIYTYNHQEVVITTTADTTLEEFVGLINNDANNPGLTANLLYYNDAYHLVLNGNDAGSDYEIGVNASNTEVWQTASPFTAGGANAPLATKIMDLDEFDGTFAGDETITISGQQHDGTAVNQVFAVNANTKLDHLIEEINDAFGGTATATLVHGQIRLTDHTSGASSMQLSLTYNPGSGSTTFDVPAISQSTQGGSVTATLAAYAEADFTETQAAQDSRIKVDGFPAGAEEWISRSSNTIDNVLSGVTLHLHDTGTVQVNLTRDIESVKQKLNSMVDAYNVVLAFINENTGYEEETQTAGTLMGDATVRSINNEVRMPLLRQTSGFVVDVDSFLMPGEIGLELDGEGMLSLDNSAFDEAIAEDYMGVLAIIGADKTGSSTSNTVQLYGASSKYTTAGTYDVEVTVSGGAITGARMKLATESTYRDATFSGNIVTGDSSFTSGGDAVYAENGLQLSVDLSQDGTFTATVRVKQGFAGAMEDALDRFLKATSGWLTLDQESVKTQIKNLDDRIAVEEDRLAQKEERLVARYARLEKTLALLQSQMAALGML